MGVPERHKTLAFEYKIFLYNSVLFSDKFLKPFIRL